MTSLVSGWAVGVYGPPQGFPMAGMQCGKGGKMTGGGKFKGGRSPKGKR